MAPSRIESEDDLKCFRQEVVGPHLCVVWLLTESREHYD